MARMIKPISVRIDDNLLKFMRYGEEVKPVRNTSHYFVTSCGRVFSGKKAIEYTTIDNQIYIAVAWKELRQRLANGYYSVNIDGKREYVHKLVYENFNQVVDTNVLKIVHVDTNKLNNNVSNLAITWRNKKAYQEHKNYMYKEKMKNFW